jgi:putative transposase
MPRRNLGPTGGMIFHVLNRGDHRQTLFRTPADYDAFIAVLRVAVERFGMRLLAYTVMPTHWHLVIWPRDDGDLSSFMGWLTLMHARRWKTVYGTWGEGPVYQGRFKAIPVQDDCHFLVLCAYVERNQVRGRLVEDARAWRWSSACDSGNPSAVRLAEWPVPRPGDWVERINRPEPPVDLERIRNCVVSSSPLGSEDWCAATIERLGWRSGVRPVGRPMIRPPHASTHRSETTPGLISPDEAVVPMMIT